MITRWSFDLFANSIFFTKNLKPFKIFQIRTKIFKQNFSFYKNLKIHAQWFGLNKVSKQKIDSIPSHYCCRREILLFKCCCCLFIRANLDENLIELNGSLKIEKPQQTDKKVDKPKNEWCLHLLKQNELFETTIDTYLELKEMLESINSSKCTHLLNYLIGSIEIYHEKLKKILTKYKLHKFFFFLYILLNS